MRLAIIIQNVAIIFIALQQGWKFLHQRYKAVKVSAINKKALHTEYKEQPKYKEQAKKTTHENPNKEAETKASTEISKRKEELEAIMRDLLYGDTTARWAESAIDFCNYKVDDDFRAEKFKKLYTAIEKYFNKEQSKNTMKLKTAINNYYTSVMNTLESKKANHSSLRV